MTVPIRLTKPMRRDFCENANSGFYKPALAFEIQHGLSGLAEYYAFPAGHNARSFEQHVRAYSNMIYSSYETLCVNDHCDVEQQIRPVMPVIDHAAANDWAQLVALNPQLSAIKFDDANLLLRHHALYGVASLLNPDDINFQVQLSACEGALVVTKMPDLVDGWSEAFNRVSRKAGNSPQWTPALRTLQKIDALLPDL